MPKDEFDFDDPMELQGVGLFTHEDTTDVMAECFVEEFLRMGFDHHRILTLFKNPHYIGMNMVLQNRGEKFVYQLIEETFAKWGRQVSWNVIDQKTSETQSATSNNNHPIIENLRRSK